jgi:hypothetical protein
MTGTFVAVPLHPNRPTFIGRAPSFWWPGDRAWFVSTDIDFPCTYVGGTRRLFEVEVGC